MKTPFKPGDRVAVYTGTESAAGWRITGTVAKFPIPECPGVMVDRDDGRRQTYHPKQCRRLVKRERRRVWCHYLQAPNESNIGRCFIRPTEDPYNVDEWIEFVEVPRKAGQ
jgi:predicted RNA-binding Zn-ribbon protein involved in translation (DUF1610 family)